MTVDKGSELQIWVLGDRYRILRQAEEYSVIEVVSAKDHGPPPHSHHRESESIYVLEGEIEIDVEGSRKLIRPGEFVDLPIGQTHGYRTVSETSRHLTVIVPGNFVNLFIAIGHVSREEGNISADRAHLLSLAPDYGLEIVQGQSSPEQK